MVAEEVAVVALDGGKAELRDQACTALEGVVLLLMASARWDSWRWHRTCPVRGSVLMRTGGKCG